MRRYVQHIWGPYIYRFVLAGLSTNLAFPHRAQYPHLTPIHPVAQRQVSHRRLLISQEFVSTAVVFTDFLNRACRSHRRTGESSNIFPGGWGP